MRLHELLDAMGHEQVTICRDPSAGYTGILAVHSTVLGPAVGGTRLREYGTFDAAVEDALRLSRGMTYKNALAGLPFGGGKAVILGPAPADDEARRLLFEAHGRAIDRLGGLFVTGEDVGTTTSDMESVATGTPWVAGREGGMGDPSPFTARGVVRAMEAVAADLWGTPELAGRTVTVQGLGNVGTHVAALLSERGAHLVVADVVPARVEAAVGSLGAKAVPPDRILDVEADVFAPCALGGVLDRDAVERIRVRAVCGGANNQLRAPEQGERLRERGIRYVPDYVANAGGVISGSVDIAGWDRTRMNEALASIYDTVTEVLALADRLDVPPERAADRIVEDRLGAASEAGS